MTEYDYDVFISYSSRDADWVQTELLPRLEAHGLRVCIDVRDFMPGAPRVAEMERAVTTNQYTLLVLTQDYLSSAWAEFERYMLQTLDPAARKRRLIPLLHKRCELPPSLDYLTRIDFTAEQDWNRLLNAFPSPLSRKTPDDMPLDAVPDPATLPPGSLMPLSPNPLFVGRQRELRELARLLQGGATAAINPVAATTGLGGIGKTQLASEFAHRYGQFFPGGVFWLSFENADAVPGEIVRCGGAGYLDLRPNFADLKLDDQVALVLQAWQLDRPRLLVFDNCEDEALLDRWRPTTGGCRVLVTSRRAEWAATLGVQPLRLETLPRAESIALLRKHRPDLASDDADLDALAEELGDLPLALHVAGSFLKLYKASYGPADYLAELRAAGGVDEELLTAEDGYATGHDQSVIGTFRLSYDKLDASKPTDALALRLLARAAHCAPSEPLPHNLLIATAGIDLNDKQATRPATRSIKRLSDLGLIEIEDPDGLRLHRLLATFVRSVSTDAEALADVEQYLLSFANYFNNAGDARPLLVLRSQLRAVTDVALERFDERGAELCGAFGHYLWMVGDYRGAQRYLEQAVAINEQVLGQEHPETAMSLNNLGALLQAQGDYAGARLYYERALMTVEQVLGPQHPDVATSLNNLGAVLQAQGDYVGARPYYERALVINGQVLGEMHPSTATSLNNVGGLLDSMGDLAGARPYYERALMIVEQVLGPEHRDTASSLNNLGYLLQAQGDYIGARPYYERALAINERVLGGMHPDTATSLNNLGYLLQAQGDLAGAQQYYEWALAIREQVLGLQHPDIAMSLNNLGGVLQAQGDLAGARRCYERALAIREQVLGLQHPDMAQILNNLGYLLQAERDYIGARRYFEWGLTISEQVLGGMHPNTALSLNNLGAVFYAQGDYTGAQQYFERALAICEQGLGAEHPDTARSLHNLGGVLQAQGNLVGARQYYERALAICEQGLGAEHPDTARSLNNLGGVLDSMGDLVGARQYYERALAIRRQVLGPMHPDTATSLNNMGHLLQTQGDYTGAKSYYEQALAIFVQTLGLDHPYTQGVHRNLAALDAAPQSAEQQIAKMEQQAVAMVEVALAKGNAEQRAALVAQIEDFIRHVERNVTDGSPYLALAARLRELAARLDEDA